MTAINRRKALTTVAAAPAAVALGAGPALAEADEDANPFAVLGGGPRCDMLTAKTDHWAPEYPKGSIFVVDPDRVPKDGDLVHVRLRFSMVSSRDHDFCHVLPYSPRGGHDGKGRFCSSGDPHEIVRVIAPCKFSRKNFDDGLVTILGTVCAVMAKL